MIYLDYIFQTDCDVIHRIHIQLGVMTAWLMTLTPRKENHEVPLQMAAVAAWPFTYIQNECW